jgi:hypothetical protein
MKLKFFCHIYIISLVSYLFLINLNGYIAISDPRLMETLAGDGAHHTHILYKFVDDKLAYVKLHDVYPNNYYLISFVIYKLITLFSSEILYTNVIISLVVTNFIFFYLLIFFSFQISFILSKNEIFSLLIVQIIFFSKSVLQEAMHIYPDIVQLSLMIISTYCLLTNNKYRFELSIVFASLAFGTKIQGAVSLLFILLFFYFYVKLPFFKKMKKIITYLFIFFIIHLNLNPDISVYVNFFSSIFYVENKFPQYIEIQLGYEQLKTVYHLFVQEFNFYIIFLIFFPITGYFFIFFKSSKELIINNYLLLNISILILILILIQLYFYRYLLQGPRYIFHMYPFILIIVSVILPFAFKSLNTPRVFFKFFSINHILLLFFISSVIFNNQNIKSEVKYAQQLKQSINDNLIVQGGLFFEKNIIKDSVKIAAAKYSYVPSKFKYVNYDYMIKDLALNEEKFKKYDYIFLNIDRPGAFIWPINSNIKELKIKKFSDLGQYMQSYGEKNVIAEQAFVSKILMTWELFYINPSVIILKKN